VSGPVDWLPEVALVPDHVPEAVQEVASVEDQVSVEVPPLGTDVGFAASDAVGPAELSEDSDCLAPPQPANARPSTGTSSSVFTRNIGTFIICFLAPMPQLNQVLCSRHNPLHLLGGSFSRSISHFRPENWAKY